ncbi:MAG: hypothetical protein J5998_05435, partial [Clostridia bacterium]|nr:hypothetical protein [Clostridia bacterium]
MERFDGLCSPSDAFSMEAFRAADTPLQPAYAWIWNAPIQMDEVMRRLDGMKRAGIRTVYVLPEPKAFRPSTMRTFLAPEYLTDDFMRLVRRTADYALSIGMNVWMYDEGGWPSGGACGRSVAVNPRLIRKNIQPQSRVLPAGAPYEPVEGEIAAFAAGRRVRIDERFEVDTPLHTFFVQVSAGSWATDSLEDEIGRTFVAETHERYTRFLGDLFGEKGEDGRWKSGTRRVPLMFTDEPGTGPFPWPDGFAEKFIARYGYDLRDFLPELFNMDEDAEGPALRARQDYRELQGDLFRENYLTPIREWCRRNNVLATGHLDIDHLTDGCLYHGYGTVLEQLRVLDVPGVDVIWRQIDIPHEGRPACGEGNGFFERFASSAAAQTGGKLALSESFGVYGASMTGDLARFTINHQLVRGINLFNFMDMSYSARGGLPFVERPEYMEELPGFFHLRAMNDYTARASYLMQLGAPGGRSALFFPARDIWAGGKRRRQAVDAFDALGQALEARQIDFDIIDEDGLRACAREGDALKLGLAVYESLLIPDGASLPDDLTEKLRGIRREADPALVCDTACLRVRKRLLPDGSGLYMLFNESGERVDARIRFPETGLRVLLDANSAAAYQDEGETLSFGPGEAKYFLFPRGEAGFARQQPRTLKKRYAIDRFTVRKTRET